MSVVAVCTLGSFGCCASLDGLPCFCVGRLGPGWTHVIHGRHHTDAVGTYARVA